MADVRCVRCGNLIPNGFLCDSCQRGIVTPGQFQATGVMDRHAPPRRVDPMALAVAAIVVMLGLISLIAWPRLQKSMSESVASSGSPGKMSIDEGDLPTGRATRITPESRTAPTLQSQPAATTQTPSETRPSGPAAVQPTHRVIDASSWVSGNEQAAEQTLNAFLNEYCERRAEKIGKTVKTSTVTWWPMGAGVVVELDEGGQYRQGTAQFTPKSGWAWLIQPDTVASTN